MEAKPSYSISELAGLSKQSESKIRRRIGEGPGQLALVVGARPRRIVAASAHEYLRRLIADGPQLPDGVTPEAREVSVPGDEVETARARVIELEKTVRDLEAKLDKVEEENEKFRNSIQGLRQSQAILLDDIGQYTSPKFPNN